MVRLDQYKEIKLPFSFEEMPIKKDDSKENKRVLDKYNGRLVVVKDFHQGSYYHSGVLRVDEDYPDCYFLLRNEGKKNEHEQRYHYHDLQSLLVPVLS